LSCEPLLGPLDLARYTKKKGIHWIIAGGESGPGSRPMNPDWVRGLRDFSAKQGVAFHFKQWGNFAPAPKKTSQLSLFTFPEGPVMVSQHKAANGRLLDGKTHDEFPM
jgi:protein gp37